MSASLTPKNTNNKNCELCDFMCVKESEWTRHLNTRKHQSRTNSNNLEQKNAQKHVCNTCSKEYSARNSLWYHAQNCKSDEKSEDKKVDELSNNNLVEWLMKENTEFKTLLMEMMRSNTDLVKSNTDLQKQMLEVSSKGGLNMNINSHNKTSAVFNMQLFLNEQCKHAMNIKEFVDSIRLTLDDFEMVGEKGLIEGLSNIIIKSLKATDKYLRPIHCSDAKRDVMYVKDNDKWEKEGPRNDKVRMLVQNVEHKNIRLLNEYSKVHPDSLNPESPLNDHYLQLSSTATSGTDEHLDKIITKLAKETVVDK